jgi:hypothetical protein
MTRTGAPGTTPISIKRRAIAPEPVTAMTRARVPMGNSAKDNSLAARDVKLDTRTASNSFLIVIELSNRPH